MANVQCILAAGLSCFGIAACQPAGGPPAAAGKSSVPSAAEPSAPARPASAVPRASGEAIQYLSAGGTALSASYGAGKVTLHWPGGRSATLPRAESASRGGGDVYVGDRISLLRDGARIELHDGDAPAMACTASGSGR
jgi:hypothetical protein